MDLGLCLLFQNPKSKKRVDFSVKGMETRLKKNKDFQFLFNKGKRVQSSSLILIYHKTRALKVGYSVSKKHGKSVVRNRIKRLMRASFGAVKGEIKGNYYFVLLPRVREEYSYGVFLKDLRMLLKKEGLLNEKPID